jgi:hypothetical protein
MGALPNLGVIVTHFTGIGLGGSPNETFPLLSGESDEHVVCNCRETASTTTGSWKSVTRQVATRTQESTGSLAVQLATQILRDRTFRTTAKLGTRW